jgi:hypothetical protein
MERVGRSLLNEAVDALPSGGGAWRGAPAGHLLLEREVLPAIRTELRGNWASEGRQSKNQGIEEELSFSKKRNSRLARSSHCVPEAGGSSAQIRARPSQHGAYSWERPRPSGGASRKPSPRHELA